MADQERDTPAQVVAERENLPDILTLKRDNILRTMWGFATAPISAATTSVQVMCYSKTERLYQSQKRFI